MLDKFFLDEEDYEKLTKYLAIGVGIGILIGVVFDNVKLFFALGGVVGIFTSTIQVITKKIQSIKGKVY